MEIHIISAHSLIHSVGMFISFSLSWSVRLNNYENGWTANQKNTVTFKIDEHPIVIEIRFSCKFTCASVDANKRVNLIGFFFNFFSPSVSIFHLCTWEWFVFFNKKMQNEWNIFFLKILSHFKINILYNNNNECTLNTKYPNTCRMKCFEFQCILLFSTLIWLFLLQSLT